MKDLSKLCICVNRTVPIIPQAGRNTGSCREHRLQRKLIISRTLDIMRSKKINIQNLSCMITTNFTSQSEYMKTLIDDLKMFNLIEKRFIQKPFSFAFAPCSVARIICLVDLRHLGFQGVDAPERFFIEKYCILAGKQGS